MKIETISGAATAALIGFITGFLAIFQQDGVASASDISEGAWYILIGGSLIGFLKDHQALSFRRSIKQMTSGKLESPSLVGVMAILMACFMLSGCGIQRPQIDSIADGIAVSSADIETIAQTVQSLCRNEVAGGPCMAGALISTRTKDKFKDSLNVALTGLDAASQSLVLDDLPDAQSRLLAARTLLTVLSAELTRIQE